MKFKIKWSLKYFMQKNQILKKSTLNWIKFKINLSLELKFKVKNQIKKNPIQYEENPIQNEGNPMKNDNEKY